MPLIYIDDDKKPKEKCCVDCKHHVMQDGISSCCELYRDIISGGPMFCRMVRTMDDRCGLDGKLWEKREDDPAPEPPAKKSWLAKLIFWKR